MSQYICSVVVIQYNPVWEKLQRTLNSIINQQDCQFEIVIADDASKDNCFDKIEGYFRQNKVENYQLVGNKENGGTVKNVLSGIQAARGKYVRVIAPGDMLYSDITLNKIVDFMEKNQAKEVFGKMAYFQENTKKSIEVIPKQTPYDFSPYRKQDINGIKDHLLSLGDNVSGASYTWDREYYLSCLEKLVGKVRFLEDCASIYTIYDNRKICFFDEFVTWYEYGTGISTSSSNKWTKILIQDWIEFFSIMEKQHPTDRKIRWTKVYYQMCQKGWFINKVLKNILFIRRYVYDRFITKKQADTCYGDIDKDYLLKYY